MGHTASFLKDYHVLPRKKKQRLPLLRLLGCTYRAWLLEECGWLYLLQIGRIPRVLAELLKLFKLVLPWTKDGKAKWAPKECVL